MSRESTTWVWIDRPEQLSALLEDLTDCFRLAMDTEADGFHAYRPKLCLIQLAWEGGPARSGGSALIDPLALGENLRWMRGLCESASTEMILHGADYDIRLLKRDAGLSIRGLFDTQIAARLLGWKRTGLATLAEETAAVKLDKSQRRVDWARRPLSLEAREYAAKDVDILFRIRDAMADRLEEKGRLGWLEEECRELEKVEALPEEIMDHRRALRRIARSGGLSARQRAVLAQLALWREQEARRRNVPAIFILQPKTMIRLVKDGIRDLAGLSKAGLPPPVFSRYGKSILSALAEGRRLPLRAIEERKTAAPAADRPEIDRRVLEELKVLRLDAAKRLGIEAGVLCSTQVLEKLARDLPKDEEGFIQAGMRAWQATEFGPLVSKVLDRR